MIVCSICQYENRTEAKFCFNCGANLLGSTEKPAKAVTQPPVSEVLPETSEQKVKTRPLRKAPRRTERGKTDTRPIEVLGFEPRPEGAIFGKRYRFYSLTTAGQDANQYQVVESFRNGGRARMCSNPACGAIYQLLDDEEPIAFCMSCGEQIDQDELVLNLTETRAEIYGHASEVIELGLSHGSVRAPLTSFCEVTGGVDRYCLVSPLVEDFKRPTELNQVLAWGIQLALGLDYLHKNGLSFSGEIDESLLGVVNGRAVWANFERCTLHKVPECPKERGQVPPGVRTDDLHALTGQLFSWLTGKAQFEPDLNLLPVINEFFERAMSAVAALPGAAQSSEEEPQITIGFVSGKELADALERLLTEITVPQAVDFRLGRRTSVGVARSLNEDSLITVELGRIQQSFSRPLGVFVVADGMGGHAAGEIASGTIANIIAKKVFTDLASSVLAQGTQTDYTSWLQETVAKANKAVFDLRKSAGADMGSTLVMAIVDGTQANIAHVGDSRAYLLNNDGIQPLTTDHSLVERLVATGQITREQARTHEQRNVIYRSVGDKPRVESDITVHTLASGDNLLLCSDGLNSMVEDNLIWDIVVKANSPQEACDKLIEAANAAGGDDNITVILVKLESI